MQVSTNKNSFSVFLFILPAVLLIFFGDSPVKATLLGSLLLGLLNFIFGYFLSNLIFNYRVPITYFERSLVFQIFGVAALGLWALLSFFTGSLLYGTIVLILMYPFLICYRWKFSTFQAEIKSPFSREPVVPIVIVIFSLLYTLVCVILPFAYFSRYSLVREMFSDGFQRFGVIYGLSKHIPPANIFLSGNDLSYYWFSLMPAAFLQSTMEIDVFTAWKIVETQIAFISIIGIWYLLNLVFRSRHVATITILFGFLFSSYEIFAGEQFKQLYHLFLEGNDNSLMSSMNQLKVKDPDHVVGVLTTYSDQLFLEDYLYIPQNAFAIFLLSILLFTISNNYWIVASLIVATIAGINSFVFLPTIFSYLIVLFSCLSIRSSISLFGFTVSLSLLFLIICNIVEIPILFTIIPVALLLYHSCKTDCKTHEVSFSLRVASIFLILSFFSTFLLLRTDLVSIFFLNYGFSFVLSFFALLYLADKKLDKPLMVPLLFIICYLIVHLFLTILSVWLVSNPHTGILATLLDSLSSKLSPFNYYHKAGKGARLFLSILGALGAVWCLESLSTHLKVFSKSRTKKYIKFIATIAFLPAALTGIIRANTYSQDSPTNESTVADFMVGRGINIDSVVLLEDFRNSKLPQLLPISTYYYSSWTGAVNGVSHLSGTWSEQYVTGESKVVARKREAELIELFGKNINHQSFKDFLIGKKIDYFLSLKNYDLEPCARGIFESNNLYLYEISLECRLY